MYTLLIQYNYFNYYLYIYNFRWYYNLSYIFRNSITKIFTISNRHYIYPFKNHNIY